MEYTQIIAIEKLKEILANQLITSKEFNTVVSLLKNNEISAEEICTAYIPHLEGVNRHR